MAGTNLGLGDRTRGNDVGSHATRTIFDRNAVRQGIDTSLGNRHMGLERHTAIMNGSAHEDNSTTSPNRRRLN
jgi:hypothetical protein